MKTFKGIEILSVMPIGAKAQAVAGPYKGEIIEHDKAGFFWEKIHVYFENVRFKVDGYFSKTEWMLIPTPFKFDFFEFKRLVDSKMVVRCDLSNHSRIFWNDGTRIATRKIDSDKVSYSTFLFYDEMGDGKWSVYPEGGFEV